MPNLCSNIFVKNMVCDRCIKVVGQIMNALNYPVKHIGLGVVEFEKPVSINKEVLSGMLRKEGFDLIDDKNSKLVSAIKSAIIGYIHHQKSDTRINMSTYLEESIGQSYSTLSSIFSKMEGRTIEKYAIQQRIEKAKELLVYGEKTISEIAWELGYSSSQYLSNQFKAETGISPSAFRAMASAERTPLDKI